MKKYLYAGLLATTLCAPVFAQNKFVAASPEDPLHRRSVALCIVVLVGLRAFSLRKVLPQARHPH